MRELTAKTVTAGHADAVQPEMRAAAIAEISMQHANPGQSSLRSLLLIALTSGFAKFALRVAIVGDSDYWQSGYSFYHRMALTLLHHGRLAFGADETGSGGYACFRPPGYPVFVAAISWLTNDSAIAFIACEAALSTVAVVLVYWVTRMMADPRAALFSAAIYACLPYSFYHDTQLQENVLYNGLSLLGVALLVFALRQRRQTSMLLLSGIATGAAVLTRMSHLASAVALLAVVFGLPAGSPRGRLTRSLAFAAGLALMICPWLVRNRMVSGHWALTSESGFALARAHNAETFRHYPYRGSIDLSWQAWHQSMPPAVQAELKSVSSDEFAASAWYRRQAIEFIKQRPSRAFWQGWAKVAVNFAGLLSPQQGLVKNWTYSLSYWGLTLLAIAGVLRIRREPYLAALAAITAAHAVVSFVYWAHTSHRSFLDPLLAVPAGIGLAAYSGRIVGRRGRTASVAAAANPGCR